jgi:hypothetical protein
MACDHLTLNLLLVSVVDRQHSPMSSNLNMYSGQGTEARFLNALKHAYTHLLLAVNYVMQSSLPGTVEGGVTMSLGTVVWGGR